MPRCRLLLHAQEQAVDVWRRLRRPFVLPCGAPHHACEWEAIDVDLLGCRVCGDIHACDVCTCTDVIETTDSVICSVSGAVLRNLVYSEVEFVDTVALSGPVTQFDEDIDGEIDQAVDYVLMSAKSKRQRRLVFCDTLLRWSRQAATPSTHRSLVAACAAVAQKAQSNPYVFVFVARERLLALVAQAKMDCHRILRFMVTCGMPIKTAEAQRLTVGVLYLMRHGISDADTVVLQKSPEIAQLLPMENLLLKHYGIHPKFITEAENKIKFCLRLKMA